MLKNLIPLTFMLLACSSSSDPRCESLCAIETNGLDVCSANSADQCLELCELKLEGAEGLCGDCLLERARFRAGSQPSMFCRTDVACLETLCSVRGCMYCSEDDEARARCNAEVGAEVACDTEFRPVLDCAAACTE